MPQLYQNKVAVTQEELSQWFTPTALRVTIHRHKELSYGIKKVQSGGNGRAMLVDYDSLPKHIKEEIPDPRKHSHILEMFYQPDEKAIAFFSQYQFEDYTKLPLTHQEQYATNAAVIRAVLKMAEARKEMRQSMGKPMKRGLVKSLLDDAHSFNDTLASKNEMTHTLPTSEKRFKQALKDFETIGYESLISGKFKNKNSQKVDDELLQLLNSLFISQTHKPTRTEVSRHYSAFLSGRFDVIHPDTGEVFDHTKFAPINDATIINWLGRWDQTIASYMRRSGNRQVWMQNFKPYHSLQIPKYSGSILSVDDRQPPFFYAKGKRVWFYMAIDVASNAITTCVYGTTKEGIILEFYRQMLRNYHEWNIPLPLELEGEISLNHHYKNTFLMPGRMFKHVRLEANNARGKIIETRFKKMRYEIEKDNIGWIARPFARSESNQSGPKEPEVLTYEAIVNRSLLNIREWNNRPCPQNTEVSCWDYFVQNQNPECKSINYRGIITYIGHISHTTCNAGIVKFQNQEWLLGNNGEVVFGKELIAYMSECEDNKLEVRWLDGNDGEVIRAYVFIGDRYICELRPKPVYNRATAERGPEDERAREIMSKYVNSITGYAREKAASIPLVEVIDRRQHTISNSFNIRGMDGQWLPEDYNPDTMDVEILDDAPEDEEQYTPKTKSLKDRF